jgi:glycosyltransferase involved in cell wall biosynthesis
MLVSVIVPFLDEEGTLQLVLDSVAAQTRVPDRLLLVDDGSSDGCPEIAARFAAAHAWATVARRPRREGGPDRLAGGSAVRAFAWGVEQLDGPWDVVAKIDADIRLTPTTLATVERAFEEDPRLGIAGPFVTVIENGQHVRHRGRPEQVLGATRFYRSACFDEISPLPLLLGWDTIDYVRAQLRGWRTYSVEVPEGDPMHLRPMSSRDGVLRGYRRRGVCAWCAGEPFLHVILMGAQLVGDRPRVLAGTSYVIGWLGAALRRMPRAEPEVLDAVRRDTLARIRARARLELAGLLRTG